MKKLLVVSAIIVIFAVLVGAIRGFSVIQAPTPSMPILGGERNQTAPSSTPISTLKIYRATQLTKLYAVSGSMAMMFDRAAPGNSWCEVLYSFWVGTNNPGPGPFAAGYTTFQAALGTVTWRSGNLIQKLTANTGELSSETVPFNLNFEMAPIVIQPGQYLVSVADYLTHSDAGTNTTDYGDCDYEIMPNFDVDHSLDRITPP